MRIASARSFASTVIAALLWRILGYSQRRLEPLPLPRLLCLPSDFLGKHIICNGVFERETMEYVAGLLETRQARSAGPSIFIDIGANIGNHTCFFAPRFDLTIAVEPSSVTASILRANILLNTLQDKVAVVQAAVSDHSGKATHYTSSGDNLGGSSLDGQRRDTVASTREEVELRTGDSIVAGVAPPNAAISFVKIDVEGHEHAVLLGMTETLRRHRPLIMFEADNGRSAADCLELLRELGYPSFMEIVGDADAKASTFMRFFKRLLAGGRCIEIRELKSVELTKYYEAIVCIPSERAA